MERPLRKPMEVSYGEEKGIVAVWPIRTDGYPRRLGIDGYLYLVNRMGFA
jgi:hypothetical protein